MAASLTVEKRFALISRVLAAMDECNDHGHFGGKDCAIAMAMRRRAVKLLM
jgi:hypothetical protein